LKLGGLQGNIQWRLGCWDHLVCAWRQTRIIYIYIYILYIYMTSRSLLNTNWHFIRKVIAKSTKYNWTIWKSLVVTYSERRAAVTQSTWRLCRGDRNLVTYWGPKAWACCHLPLAARNVWIDTLCVCKGKTAWIMAQVSGTIVQNLAARTVRNPLFVSRCAELHVACENRGKWVLFGPEAGAISFLQNVLTSSEARTSTFICYRWRWRDFF